MGRKPYRLRLYCFKSIVNRYDFRIWIHAIKYSWSLGTHLFLWNEELYHETPRTLSILMFLTLKSIVHDRGLLKNASKLVHYNVDSSIVEFVYRIWLYSFIYYHYELSTPCVRWSRADSITFPHHIIINPAITIVTFIFF